MLDSEKWNTETLEQLDWEIGPKKAEEIGRRIFNSSHTYRWLPLNGKLHKRGASVAALCTVCGE